MLYEVDEDKLYLFTVFSDAKYHTVFPGWLRRDFIKSFEALETLDPGVSRCAHVRLSLGENTFVTDVGAPLYLLDYDEDDIFEFASDNRELDLFPSGNIPADLDMEPVLDYPTYFTKGVEPLIKFKLFNQFCANRDGVWVPLEV
jgi:hypothetical protein